MLTSFSRGFSVPCESLDRPLRVAIPDEHMISYSNVYWGCVLDIFSVEFSIDLIPIAMGDVYVIVGMDWLSLH